MGLAHVQHVLRYDIILFVHIACGHEYWFIEQLYVYHIYTITWPHPHSHMLNITKDSCGYIWILGIPRKFLLISRLIYSHICIRTSIQSGKLRVLSNYAHSYTIAISGIPWECFMNHNQLLKITIHNKLYVVIIVFYFIVWEIFGVSDKTVKHFDYKDEYVSIAYNKQFHIRLNLIYV